MAKVRITLSGSVDRQPKFNQDGTVDLVLKGSMSSTVPKGLKCLGDSFYIVHVGPKTWTKVAQSFQIDSFLIIQGEPKANKNSKDTPFIEVVCFDISIKGSVEKGDSKEKTEAIPEIKELPKVEPLKETPVKEIQKKSNRLETKIPEERNNLPKPEKAKKQERTQENKFIKWYEPEEIRYVSSEDIVMTEPVHFETQVLSLKGILKTASTSGNFTIPLAVKPLENGKYGLVMGMRQFAVAKMLNMEKVPVVFRDMNREELTKVFGVL